MSKLKCIHEPESNECASVKKRNWFLYSKYLISFFAIYFWANEKVTACENNDQGLVSTMITLKKEINIVLRQTHIDYAKLCMHYFDSNLFKKPKYKNQCKKFFKKTIIYKTMTS